MKNDIDIKYHKTLEDIKHINAGDEEYWLARELAPVLEYAKWENFNKVIERAMLACKNSGHEICEHFREVSKMIEMPVGTPSKSNRTGFPDLRKSSVITSKPKQIIDYKLTRYACYLIVQNGDPRKQVIAYGQTYFAVQTRRQEEADYISQLDEDNKRLVVRNDIKQWNQLLAEAAHNSGVITDEEYAQFQNAGYSGLYGGETVDDIRRRKKLKEEQKILDFMSSPELIANLFRISQTEEKLKKDKIAGADKAALTHNKVGQEVREAIKKIGGTLPEDMETPKKSTDQVAREQVKKIKELSKKKKLILDE